MAQKTLWLGMCALLLLLAACSGGGTEGGAADRQPSGNEAAQRQDHMGPASTGTSGTDGGAPAKDGPTTIVFSTFWPDDRFVEAKRKYEALHPDVEIKLEYVETDDANVEAELEKFVTTTNAALLAGTGPDLLEMDKLPVDSYVRNGLLVDLNTWIARDSSFRKEDYFANILDNAGVGGGLYGMPLSFFLYGLAGDEDALAQAGVQIDDASWSWSDFAEMAEGLAGGVYPNAINTVPEYMLNWIVSDNYSLFVDEAAGAAHFDSAAFIDLMEQVKSMGDRGVIGEGQPYFYPVQINSPGDYLISLKSYLSPNMKLYTRPHAGDAAGGGYFKTYRTIGMNANSQVKEQAWDFITFMMSDEIATPPNTAGFPINRKMFAQQLEQLRQDGSVPTVKEGPLRGVPVEVDDAKLSELERYLTGAEHAVPHDPGKVQEILLNEVKAYFSGQKSAADVAKLIQNKATTYLNE